jgi:uncharacterized membrane protein YjgN (DUF898 family)
MTSLDVPADVGAVRFLGQRRAYWRLLIRGAVLLLATLGIYRFWLATDVRRFLWSNTEVAGEPLEYTGTALELLIGFLAAIAILIPIYGAFFLAALDLGTLGQLSGAIGFISLAVLGQIAVYRARRYRLTRTVFRGIRFHQGGSAWRYALRAILWWSATALTCGLAYPFQLASLERYKMRNTYYGDLAGRFAGAGFRLLLRGLPLWLLVVAPLAAAVAVFIEALDWTALIAAAAQGGGSALDRIAGASPNLAAAIVFGLLMVGCAASAAALLYPAFQALTIRWWSSGLRLGDIEFRSRLRTAQVYGAYARFLGFALLFSIVLAIVGVPALLAAQYFGGADEGSVRHEIVSAGGILVGYVVAALGYSTIYRATVKLSLWQLGMEALQLSGIAALERVKAIGAPSSAVGEGLADALNVGGY